MSNFEQLLLNCVAQKAFPYTQPAPNGTKNRPAPKGAVTEMGFVGGTFTKALAGSASNFRKLDAKSDILFAYALHPRSLMASFIHAKSLVAKQSTNAEPPWPVRSPCNEATLANGSLVSLDALGTWFPCETRARFEPPLMEKTKHTRLLLELIIRHCTVWPTLPNKTCYLIF